MSAWGATVALAALALAIGSRALGGQDTSSPRLFDPLTTTLSSPLVCQWIPPAAEDSSDIVLEFKEVAFATMRTTRAGFDSSGAPIYVHVFAFEPTSTEQDRLHILLSNLKAPTRGYRAVVTTGSDVEPPAGEGFALPRKRDGDSVTLPKGWSPMPAADVVRARALADTVWSRRCPRTIRPNTPGARPPVILQ
jgi:hypothetical protein